MRVPACKVVHVCAMPGPLAVSAGEVFIFQLKPPGGKVVNEELHPTQLVLGPTIANAGRTTIVLVEVPEHFFKLSI